MDPDLGDTPFLVASLTESCITLSYFKVRSNIKDLNKSVFEACYEGVFSLIDVHRSYFFSVKSDSRSQLTIHFQV